MAYRGQLDVARAVRAALALRPNFADAQRALAGCYLAEGDYARGWPAYKARLRMPRVALDPGLPRWSGESLAGRSLLIIAEQGLGDTIQFVRYARLPKQRRARVVLAAPAKLGPVLAPGGDWDELCLLGPDEKLPTCDFYLPLLSAPYALLSGRRRSLATSPIWQPMPR